MAYAAFEAAIQIPARRMDVAVAQDLHRFIRYSPFARLRVADTAEGL